MAESKKLSTLWWKATIALRRGAVGKPSLEASAQVLEWINWDHAPDGAVNVAEVARQRVAAMVDDGWRIVRLDVSIE